MKRLPITIGFVFALLLCGCTSTQGMSPLTEESSFLPAEKPDAEVGIVSVQLDAETDDVIVFHDYFGVFVYSLNEKKCFTV